MSFLQSALDLASLGFHVFPLQENGKLPAIADFPRLATTDRDQITRWWTDPVLGLERPNNIGISTSRFGDGAALIVIDVDNKPGKNGDDELLKLELEGLEFPETYEQGTPTGGRHIVYSHSTALKQGVNVLGPALDIRSKGGYIVARGSCIEGKHYGGNVNLVHSAPDWLVKRLKKVEKKETAKSSTKADQKLATSRAIKYLQEEAPIAVQSQGGDQTTFSVAARLKDFGLTSFNAFCLLLEYWNSRCEPPWLPEDLQTKVENAFKYGSEVPGVAAPDLQFQPASEKPSEALHPFDVLNKEYAFVVAGGGSHILHETKNHKGQFFLDHLSIQAFHQKHAAETMQIGNSQKPLTELWMRSPKRRSYDGICFAPGVEVPREFYNLWRGFSVEPIAKDEKPTPTQEKALKMFLDHALENVCQGNRDLWVWLIGYFAHLIQKPAEKPLTALVMRGSKGTGKNALIDRVGYLISNHYECADDKRYLTGNFNGHLENLLLFALDEAFWSGDKQAEGVLKGLITSRTRLIEHKGKEPYRVDNCTRVVIIGNEDWLVPATHDERRFAVFDVGDGKKQNTAYFKEMREAMENGGYRYLLRYLLDFDLKQIDVNVAPVTEGLKDQKLASLGVFHQWWHTCLVEGRLVYSDFEGGWHEVVERDRLRDAFGRYFKSRNVGGRVPDDVARGKLLRQVLHGFDINGPKLGSDGARERTYRLPPLNEAREAWDKFIGHPSNWSQVKI